MRIYARLAKKLALALAAVVAFAIPSLLIAPSATAADAPVERARNYYGAISISVDGAYGNSWDYNSKRAAFAASQRACKRYSDYPARCQKIVWVRNGCAAVSVKYNRDGFVSRYKWGIGGSRAAAKRAATRNFGGKILATTCTTR